MRVPDLDKEIADLLDVSSQLPNIEKAHDRAWQTVYTIMAQTSITFSYDVSNPWGQFSRAWGRPRKIRIELPSFRTEEVEDLYWLHDLLQRTTPEALNYFSVDASGYEISFDLLDLKIELAPRLWLGGQFAATMRITAPFEPDDFTTLTQLGKVRRETRCDTDVYITCDY